LNRGVNYIKKGDSYNYLKIVSEGNRQLTLCGYRKGGTRYRSLRAPNSVATTKKLHTIILCIHTVTILRLEKLIGN